MLVAEGHTGKSRPAIPGRNADESVFRSTQGAQVAAQILTPLCRTAACIEFRVILPVDVEHILGQFSTPKPRNQLLDAFFKGLLLDRYFGHVRLVAPCVSRGREE